MRIILSLLLAFNCGYAAALKPTPDPSRPELLKYSQLMRLSKKRRIAYLRQIAKLLVLLERPQAKYETAGNRIEDLQEQVAFLIRMGALLPESNAAEAAAFDLSKIVPKNNGAQMHSSGEWRCNPSDKVQFVESLASCATLVNGGVEHQLWSGAVVCEPGTHELNFRSKVVFNHKVCVTSASWDQLDGKTKDILSKGYYLTAAQSSAALGEVAKKSIVAPAPATAEGADKVAGADSSGGKKADPESGGSCAGPKPEACPAIEPGSSAETDMINAFKNSSANSECIRGGFFGHYAGNKYRRGRCQRDTAMTREMNKRLTCPKGQEICNPVVFCYGFDMPAQPATADHEARSADFKAGRTCAKVTQTFTADCEASYQKLLNSGPQNIKGFGMQTFRACDPATDMKDLSFQDEYTNLIAETKASYDRLCGVAEFKAKFCTECNIIGSHIAKANCAAQVVATADDKASPETLEGDNPAPGSTEVTH